MTERKCEVCGDVFVVGTGGWWKYEAPGRRTTYWCPTHADHKPFVDVVPSKPQ